MVELKRGNLLEADVEALVNTVNCVGVMGKGIALQFKQAFPDNFHQYERACHSHSVVPGRMFVVRTGLMNPKYIINFPTKRHWKGKAKLDDIRAGLHALIAEVNRLKLSSIAVPPLGCGNGGLDWGTVRPLIERAFAELPNVHVLLFEPAGAPAPDVMQVATTKPGLTRFRALLIRLIEAYAMPGYKLSLLEVQKLAYLLQVAGENLRLKFTKEKFGPYAESVNYVLQRMEGHYFRGYGDRSGEAGIYLLPGAVDEAARFLGSDLDAGQHFGRVSDLIEGYETPYGMELLATVHWVCSETPQAAHDVDLAVQRVRAWSDRKRVAFREHHIRRAWERLRDRGWFEKCALRPLELSR